MKKYVTTLASTVLILAAHNAGAGDAELVDYVLSTVAMSCDDIGVEKGKMLEVIAALKTGIVSQLKDGKRVQLDNFGTFYAAPKQVNAQSKASVKEVLRFETSNTGWIKNERSWLANHPIH